MKKSWFVQKKEDCLTRGVVISKKKYRMMPTVVDSKVVKSTCQKCQSSNGFVFEAIEDKAIKVVFCLRCDGCTMYKPEEAEKKAGNAENADSSGGRCQATTKAGSQCKLTAQKGSKFCAYHNKMVEAEKNDNKKN